MPEVFRASDESSGVDESVGVGSDGEVETHVPNFWCGDSFGDSEPNHEVAGEVHGGADGKDGPQRGDLVEEDREVLQKSKDIDLIYSNKTALLGNDYPHLIN